MDQVKFEFISTVFINRLQSLSGEAVGAWGKMNGQQMVEHVSGFFKVSNGKIIFTLITPAEQLPKYKEFLLSDKPFRENTKAPGNVVPEEPVQIRNTSMEEAINELKNEVSDFITYFTKHPGSKTVHPVFGELDFEEWVLLHYKHVTHHLKQFELI